jgi:hypothetical protein
VGVETALIGKLGMDGAQSNKTPYGYPKKKKNKKKKDSDRRGGERVRQ